MKINEGFALRKVADSYIIVATGDNIIDFSAMITINETGAFIWEKLKSEITLEELAKAMCEEYGIGYEEALPDAENFVNILIEKKVLS